MKKLILTAIVLILVILGVAASSCIPGEITETVFFKQIGDNTALGKVDAGYFSHLYVDSMEFTDPISGATDWDGSFNWDTSEFTTAEMDISALFSTDLTGTDRRKYTVYLDLTNVESDASFVSLYLSVQKKVNGTDYIAIDRKLVLKADIGANAEPGIPFVIPPVAQDIKITMQMTVALADDVTIYYAVIKEHLE